MRYLILCLAFLSLQCSASEISDQDLSFTEALEIFFENNGGNLKDLRPPLEPSSSDLSVAVKEMLLELSQPDDSYMECRMQAPDTGNSSDF